MSSFLWARRVAPHWQAIAMTAALLVLPAILFRADFGLPTASRLSAGAAVIALAGVWLVARTLALSRRTAMIGGAALVCGVAALVFRLLDGRACAVIPIGTHFLWHIFLSSAAFLCVLTLLRLRAPAAPA